MTKSGFLYIYTSNETSQDVYFDNLVVTHNGGPVLEETHYYPFGLTMAGISSNALKGTNYPENRFKYNGGTELNLSLDLNWYETDFRGYDPQIGRFWQMDQLADDYPDWTPYHFAMNNPLLYNDPFGLDTMKRTLPEVVVTGKQPTRNNVLVISNSPGTIVRSSNNFNQPQLTYTPLTPGDPRSQWVYDAINNATEIALGVVIPVAKLPVAIRWLNRLRMLSKAEKFFGKKIAKGGVRTRTTDAGEKAVEVKFEDGSKIDIDPTRVKAWEEKTIPYGPKAGQKIEDKVKFDNAIPGTKGYKRLPTPQEESLLDKLFDLF